MERNDANLLDLIHYVLAGKEMGIVRVVGQSLMIKAVLLESAV